MRQAPRLDRWVTAWHFSLMVLGILTNTSSAGSTGHRGQTVGPVWKNSPVQKDREWLEGLASCPRSEFSSGLWILLQMVIGLFVFFGFFFKWYWLNVTEEIPPGCVRTTPEMKRRWRPLPPADCYLTKWMNSIKVTQNASPSKHFSDKDKVLLVLYCSQFRKLLIFIWNA